jgi:hypothetical protein
MQPALTLRELARRRSSFLLALPAIGAVLFGGWLLWLLWLSDSYRRVLEGPQSVTLEQLLSLGDEAIGGWFEVTTNVPSRHLLQTTTRGRGLTTVTNHFALIEDATSGKDPAVIVQTDVPALPTTFLAWAGAFDQNGNFYKRARSQLDVWTGARFPRISLHPVMLWQSRSVAGTLQAYTAGISALSIALLAMLILLGTVLPGRLDYTRTRPIKRLRKSVRAPEGLPALVAEIDHQLAARGPKAPRTGPILLPSWLLIGASTPISASDVVWITPYVIKRKLYGVITTSTRYAIYVACRNGQKALLLRHQHGKPAQQEARVNEWLVALKRWAPWAVFGSDNTMEARFGWDRGARWRALSGRRPVRRTTKAEIIAMVDKRRDQIFAVRRA